MAEFGATAAPPSNGIAGRVRAVLAHDKLPWLAALVAFALSLPSLASGRVIDDHMHARIFADGVGVTGAPTAPLDMFSFFPEDEARRAALNEYGAWPWWASERMHVEFLRPLSAVTYALDHTAFPRVTWLMHVHSALWYALVAWLAARVLRRLIAARAVAGLAALFYAVADSHALPVGWLANRAALIAAAFGFLAFVGPRLLAPGRLAPGGRARSAGIRGGAGVRRIRLGAGAYLFAHALTLDPATRLRTRFAALAPYALVGAGWMIAYRALGYGVTGSGLYFDPAHDPVGFAWATLMRAPALAASQLCAPIADLWVFVPRDSTWLLTVGGGLFVGLCLVALRPPDASPAQRFFALGALAALVPACTTLPNDRLSFFSSFGLIALVADLAARRATLAPSRRALAWFLVGRQALGVVLFPLRTFGGSLWQRALDRGASSLGAAPELGARTLVVVNAPSLFAGHLLPLWREVRGETKPQALRVLGNTLDALEIQRTDAHTLVLRAEGGYLRRGLDEVAWVTTAPRAEGWSALQGDVRYTVLAATRDGRPLSVAARFERELEDPSLEFVVWRGTSYAPFALPAVGERVLEPALDFAALGF